MSHKLGFKSFTKLKGNVWSKVGRWSKLQYLKLLHSPGGAHKVSMGFGIGFGIEMILPITAYSAYLVFIPLVRGAKASLSAAILGNIIAKVTFLPLLLVPLAVKFGHHLPISPPHHLPRQALPIFNYLKTLLAMSIFAAGLTFVFYVIIYLLYEANRKKRLSRRSNKNI